MLYNMRSGVWILRTLIRARQAWWPLEIPALESRQDTQESGASYKSQISKLWVKQEILPQ